MKTVILCGGLGTRLSEETQLRPKPMVQVGEFPILWHIMNIYENYDHHDFVLALGYKGEVIKEYFLNFHSLNSDFRINIETGKIEHIKKLKRKWTIDLIDTGLTTLTGGRLKRLEPHLKNSGTFMLTYGDGVCDVNIDEVVRFHKSHGKIATLTAVRPPSRFGTLEFSGSLITEFQEKPQALQGWINGGFFVFEPEVFSYLGDDTTILERGPLEKLARDGQLMGYQHDGFWQCMDTMRDKAYLNELWNKKEAPWFNYEKHRIELL